MYCTPEDLVGRYGKAHFIRLAGGDADDEEALEELDRQMQAACDATAAFVDSRVDLPPDAIIPKVLRDRAMDVALYRLHVQLGRPIRGGVGTSYEAAVEWLGRVRSGEVEMEFEVKAAPPEPTEPTPAPGPERKRKPKAKAAPPEPDPDPAAGTQTAEAPAEG